MKFLFCSDVHSSLVSVDKLVEYVDLNDVDVTFFLGDFSDGFRDEVQNKRDIESVMFKMDARCFFMIPGNCDQLSSIEFFGTRNLHLKSVIFDNICFVGFGGSNHTPFGTPFELGEEEVYSQLSGLMSEIEYDNVVLLSHCPPANTNCDLAYSKSHVGSSSIRRIIEEFQPKMCFSGHIHEAGLCEDVVGGCRVFNVAGLNRGQGIVLEDGSVDFAYF